MSRLSYPEYMPNRYTLPKDLMDRLSGTLCRYDGSLVRVEYENGSKLSLYPFDPSQDEEIKKIACDDPLFDISMIEVGYANYSGKAGEFVVYMRRDAKKKYKAAFDPRYLTFLKIDGGTDLAYMNEGFWSKSFEDALTDVFPSYQEGMMLLDSGKTEVAISKELAFRRDQMGLTYMFYKTRPVGWMVPYSSKFNLASSDLAWVVERHLSRNGITL